MGEDAQVDMKGKIVMITGANSGIGKATAMAIAGVGADIVMVCRDRGRGEQAKRRSTLRPHPRSRASLASTSSTARRNSRVETHEAMTTLSGCGRSARR